MALPRGVGWVSFKGEPLLFLTENVKPAASRPTDPADGHVAAASSARSRPVHASSEAAFRPRDFAQAFRAAFEILDRRNGSTNFVKLADLRRGDGRVQPRGVRRRPADGSGWTACSRSTVTRASTARSRTTSARRACARRARSWSMHHGGSADVGRRHETEGRGGPEVDSGPRRRTSPRSGTPIRSRPIASPSRRPTTWTSPRSTAPASIGWSSLAGKAMKAPSGIGVALLGGAGVGKSHLLSRLYRWANEPAPEGGPRACYVYLHNILADPDRLPRYLLKYVVSRLSQGGRGPLFQTPLFGFLDRAIRHAYGSASPGDGHSAGVLEAYRALLRGVARRPGRLRGPVPVLPARPTRAGRRSEPEAPGVRGPRLALGRRDRPGDRPLVRPEGRRRHAGDDPRRPGGRAGPAGPRPAGPREPPAADPLHRPGRQPRPRQAEVRSRGSSTRCWITPPTCS